MGLERYGNLHTNADIIPTRDGNSRLVMTWNAKVAKKFDYMYKMYRILTSNDPSDISFNDAWHVDASAGEILSGLGNYNSTRINVEEGDLYSEYVDAGMYSGYYAVYLFIFVATDDSYYGIFFYSSTQIKNYCISNAPDIEYDKNSNKFTIGTSMEGRRLLEFHRTDREYGSPTSINNKDTLNELLLITTLNTEEWLTENLYMGYYYPHDYIVKRWKKRAEAYTVAVSFLDDNNKETISNAIDSALSQINSVLGDYGVRFKRSSTASPDMFILVGSEYELFDIDLTKDEVISGGHWESRWGNDGYITYAEIKLANDYYDYHPFRNYIGVALEEILQSMGAGYDQFEYFGTTIHSEFTYLNMPDTLTTNDANILRLLYADSTPVGGNCTDLSKSLNIPKGLYSYSDDDRDVKQIIPGDFLDANAKYKVRVFIADEEGKLSHTSPWITVETPNKVLPDKWNWTTDVSKGAVMPFYNNALHPLTATEWNNFTKRINEFREYKGLSPYSFTTVSPNTDFTPAIYNEAVAAIKGISGSGTSLSYAIPGVTNILLSSNYTSLRDGLNAVLE